MADAAPPKTYHWRRNNPGRVLDNALRRFEDRVMELLREAGHVQTRRSHVNLTRHLETEGTAGAVTDIVSWPRVLSGAALAELERYTS